MCAAGPGAWTIEYDASNRQPASASPRGLGVVVSPPMLSLTSRSAHRRLAEERTRPTRGFVPCETYLGIPTIRFE